MTSRSFTHHLARDGMGTGRSTSVASITARSTCVVPPSFARRRRGLLGPSSAPPCPQPDSTSHWPCPEPVSKTSSTHRPDRPPGEGALAVAEVAVDDPQGITQVAYKLGPGGEQDRGAVQACTRPVSPGPSAATTACACTSRPTLVARACPASSAPLTAPEDPAAARHQDVVAVTIDGPADRAGVQPGDEVLTIDTASVAAITAENAVRMVAPASIRFGQDVPSSEPGPDVRSTSRPQGATRLVKTP